MAHKLNNDEMAAAREEHFRVLDEIDRQVQAKKDTNASYNEIIGDLRTKEKEIRTVIKTGEAVPEQLALIPKDG